MKLVLSALIIAICGSVHAQLLFGKSTPVFTAGPGILREGASINPDISSDGKYLSFVSDRTDVVANDEIDSLDVFRADASRNVVQMVNRVANGTYYVPTIFSRTYISDRGQYVAFDSSEEILANGSTVHRSRAIRAGLARKTIDSVESSRLTGMSSDGNSLLLNELYGRTIDPVSSFTFIAGLQSNGGAYRSVYSQDGKVRLAELNLSGAEGRGLQVTTRSGEHWLLAVTKTREYFTPVWVSNDTGTSAPIRAHFITNHRISLLDLDKTPDLYYANALTGEMQLIPLTGIAVRAVAASRNGRFTVIQYQNGMADVVDVTTFPGMPRWIRRVNLRHLWQMSRNVSDDGRFLAGITTDYRVVRQDLHSGIGTEAGIGPYPAPPRAKIISYVNSPTGTSIMFRAPYQFLPDGSEGVFIKNTSTGITRRLPTNSIGFAVSDTGQAYVFNASGGMTYRNDELNKTVKIANSFGHVISSDGLIVMFYRREGSLDQLFVYNATTGRTTLVSKNAASIAADGMIVTPRLSANGKVIAFLSDATNLVDGPVKKRLYVYDVVADQLTAPSFSGSLGESAVVVGVSADATKIVFVDNKGQDKQISIWRYYVPRRSFTFLGTSFGDGARLSPSGNLVFSQYLFRVSDGRNFAVRNDFSVTVLLGDKRARVEHEGNLWDIDFAFPPTP